MADPKIANAVRAEINVTPLVDVVLVLLIIFMLVGPMLTANHVSPPLAQHPPARPEREGRILLTLDRNKVLRIADARGTFVVPEADTVTQLKECFERNPGRVLAVEADGRLTYGDAKKAMAGIRDAGRQSFALIAARRNRT